jgi:outer membrane immunogenic protein
MKNLLLATTALAFVAPAFAADLAPPTMPLKAPPMERAPAYSWTGCYVGGHIGGGWGHANFIDPSSLGTLGTSVGNFAPTGAGIGIDQGAAVLGGGQVGCDYQFATNWVAGIAGDFSWTNLNGSTSDPYAFLSGDPLFAGKAGVPATLHDHTEWLASVTGRVGYAWDRWLLYGKGGVAWEHSRDSIGPFTFWGTSVTNACFALAVGTSYNATGTETDTGWTVGVGLEWAFADHWAAGIEYDHYGFGNQNATLAASGPLVAGGATAPITVNQRIDAVKLILDYRFSWLAR